MTTFVAGSSTTNKLKMFITFWRMAGFLFIAKCKYLRILIIHLCILENSLLAKRTVFRFRCNVNGLWTFRRQNMNVKVETKIDLETICKPFLLSVVFAMERDGMCTTTIIKYSNGYFVIAAASAEQRREFGFDITNGSEENDWENQWTGFASRCSAKIVFCS